MVLIKMTLCLATVKSSNFVTGSPQQQKDTKKLKNALSFKYFSLLILQGATYGTAIQMKYSSKILKRRIVSTKFDFLKF
jgi:hypothetical protein